jgi:UDP-glucuronate 4-epimerase
MKKYKVLVTGCAGFIGFHVSQELIKSGKYKVFGIDNLNTYYDKKLKFDRLNILKKSGKKFSFFKIDISKKEQIINNLKKIKYDFIIHLAAQAGVRYSIYNPDQYIKSNLEGFSNIIEGSKLINVKHLIYASSSSVYGSSKRMPLKEIDTTDKPVSLYAATKKSNELMAFTLSNMFKIPTTGLRLFTVYGPFGRPDMSPSLFVNSIKKNKKINVFNHGKHTRDFTYIDDAVSAIMLILKKAPSKKNLFKIFNIGSDNPIKLKLFIKIIEDIFNKKFKIKYMPIQKGDVKDTHADISQIKKYTKFKPRVPIREGMRKFIDWHNKYYSTDYK